MIPCLKGNQWSGDILDHHSQKSKGDTIPKKIMATIFWDCQEFLLADFKERNTTFTGEYYASLIYKLKDVIKQKRQGKILRGVWLFHNNVLVHTSVAAKAAIQCCGFQALNHPAYSPNLAPNDYFLFSKLKSDLHRKKFTSDEVISAVLDSLGQKIRFFFSVVYKS
jgi:histone-lysine N-methyltransferase SETMAR